MTDSGMIKSSITLPENPKKIVKHLFKESVISKPRLELEHVYQAPII